MMRLRALGFGALILGLTVVAGCDDVLNCGPFGPIPTILIADGFYAGPEQNSSDGSFPHVGGQDFELTVSFLRALLPLGSESGTVEIRYHKDGQQVVEHWRIAGVQR